LYSGMGGQACGLQAVRGTGAVLVCLQQGDSSRSIRVAQQAVAVGLLPVLVRHAAMHEVRCSISTASTAEVCTAFYHAATVYAVCPPPSCGDLVCLQVTSACAQPRQVCGQCQASAPHRALVEAATAAAPGLQQVPRRISSGSSRVMMRCQWCRLRLWLRPSWTPCAAWSRWADLFVCLCLLSLCACRVVAHHKVA
jgi:hypothetical protein